MTAQKTYTLVFTEAELELIYDQLNCVELYDDSDENLELLSSINEKVFDAQYEQSEVYDSFGVNTKNSFNTKG